MTEHGVVAPGVNIFSTDREGRYGVMSGTSASTTHVTGAIALACQLQPDLSYEEVLALLQATTDDLMEASGSTCPAEQQGGAGRLNVTKLVNRLMPQ